MSTNGQLVFTDVDKITFKGVGNASNAVIDTLTGKIGVGVDSPDANLHVVGNSYVSTNLELGGTLIMGTVNVEAQHSLEAVTATGNTTPLTVEFTNPTTSLVASGNVEVGGDVILSGNIYNNANLSVQYTTIPAWTQVGSDIDGEAAGDWSGYSVSMSSDGTRVAIGAPYNDGTSTDAGHVRVYEWDNVSWSQVGNDIDGEAGSDKSGYSVSMSSDGTRVAIGAYGNDGNGNLAGHVRVYEWDNVSWSKVGQDIDGEAVDDEFGRSVSISSDGTRVAIGAIYNGSSAGHVRVFALAVFADGSTAWFKVGQDIDGEAAGDWSGHSVSISSDGTRVAIGAPYNDDNGSDAGHVRVYSESGGTWTQLGSDIDGEAADDRFGTSVSMSSDGTRVAIGAERNDGTGTEAGHVRVYSESGGTWTQLGSDIDGEAADDRFGTSVSMSSDGTRVAIGAERNDGTGTEAGHVRVYSESGGTWTQVGPDIDGEAASDRSGYSVSISSDGTRVAIGAIRNDGNGSEAGHVRVFDWSMITGSKKILKENIVEVGGELTVSGNATVSSSLTVSGNATVSSNLTVSGNVVVDTNTLFVDSVNNRVGIGTTTPGRFLEVYTGNGTVPGIRLRRGAGSAYTDLHHVGVNVPSSGDLEGLAIITSDGNATTQEVMRICGNGRVGIGTTSPIAALDIDGGPENDTVPALSIRGGLYDTSDLYVLNTYNVSTGVGYAAKVIGVNIKNKVETNNTVQLRNNVGGLTSAGAIYLGSDNTTGQGVFGVLTCQGSAGTTLTEKFTVTDSGNVGILRTDPTYALDVKGSVGISNPTTGKTDQHWSYSGGTDGAAGNLYLRYMASGYVNTWKTRVRGTDGNQALLNFTGQHKTYIKDIASNRAEELEGLIVSANTNKYMKMSDGVEVGQNAITVNESLPIVNISNVYQDKKCFGVISTSEDSNDVRGETIGCFTAFIHKEDGDTRVHINSLGEGALWVVNTNGTIESGDYVTTSNIAGYGMKQDSECFMNYTVAKSTMDCDFNPLTQKKRRIVKELREVAAWVLCKYEEVSEQEYNDTPEDKRKIEDDTFKIEREYVSRHDPDNSEYTQETRIFEFSVLDENNQLTWEDMDDSELEYKIRYLDANGNITTEENATHKAAFIGCTYHCG